MMEYHLKGMDNIMSFSLSAFEDLLFDGPS